MKSKSTKPVIGINLDVRDGPPPEASLQTTYLDAVVKSGGIPVLIPPVSESDLDTIMEMVDGVIFVGGLDYNPCRYNQEKEPETVLINATRDNFDFAFINKVMTDYDVPVLGICLGMQLLNVHRGGDLVQDIPKTYPESGIKHSSPDGWNKGFNEHSVRLVKGSRLYEIYQKEELRISTSHHQAVRNPGEGLKVVSSADDGVIEAIELDGERMVIGVQWHPERGYDVNKPLFDSFVKASANGNS
ncbi:hypothetical protein GC174_10055 [bacterium]|nr:hypothetical protein [bacterium]